MKKNKFQGQEVSIIVDGQEIKNTESEKLLGVVINSNMTWKDHLYGEQWRTDASMGLISQLSQRVGLIRKISQVASKQKLKMIAGGLFYSKLSYCLPLFINTWGLEAYNDTQVRFTCYTKEDNRKLQVLQNQVARLLINKPLERHLPTADLLKLSGDLSIHQMGALRTVNLVKKVLLHQKPCYLAKRLGQETNVTRVTRTGTKLHQESSHLSIVKEGFVFRGKSIFNKLPEELKIEENLKKFKKVSRKWILENVSIKP